MNVRMAARIAAGIVTMFAGVGAWVMGRDVGRRLGPRGAAPRRERTDEGELIEDAVEVGPVVEPAP